jgi:hypothetical protein
VTKLVRQSKSTAAAREAKRVADALFARDQLAERAFLLKQEGKSWFAIAEELELPEAQCKELAGEAILRAADLATAGARLARRTIQSARLDRMIMAHWASATQEHDQVVITRDGEREVVSMPPDVKAGEFILKLIAQQSKLEGLDQIEEGAGARTVIISGTDREYVDALRALREQVQEQAKQLTGGEGAE